MRNLTFALALCAVWSVQAADEVPSSSGFVTNHEAGVNPLVLNANVSPWQNGIGNGFRKGSKEVGLGVGYGIGAKILGTSETHNLAYGTIHFGQVVSDVVLKDTFLKGNWELLAQGFGGFQINTRHASLGGLDGFLRYNFATGTRLVPFVEAGVGVLYTDIGKPDLSTEFEFNEKVGAGVRWFFTESLAAMVEARFMHISNAGIKSPNSGVNTIPILVGVSWSY